MAKVLIEDGWLEVRVSWLERMLLSEKPRKLRLSSVESVDPHPPLLDMLLHWTDQRGVWLAGATTHEGYLVPSTRNPYSTLAIQVVGQRPWYVELDDQEPIEVAAQIEREIGPCVKSSANAEATLRTPLVVSSSEAVSTGSAQDLQASSYVAATAPPDPRLAAAKPGAGIPRDVEGADDVRLRETRDDDEVPPRGFRIRGDRDLSRLSVWLLAAGAFGMVAGTTIVAAGMLSGLLAVGAGLACAVIGALARGLMAHQS